MIDALSKQTTTKNYDKLTTLILLILITRIVFHSCKKKIININFRIEFTEILNNINTISNIFEFLPNMKTYSSNCRYFIVNTSLILIKTQETKYKLY